jgi:transcription elongation factor Elf1
MTYTVAVEPEAKGKAVKPRPVQISLEGKAVEEKKEVCYFCGKEVDEVTAILSKMNLGHAVCNNCAIKVVKVIAFAGRDEL